MRVARRVGYGVLRIVEGKRTSKGNRHEYKGYRMQYRVAELLLVFGHGDNRICKDRWLAMMVLKNQMHLRQGIFQTFCLKHNKRQDHKNWMPVERVGLLAASQ